ncbi:unnamed protein product (macronuclear) [Paramecium tetraurelia]|uniref:Inhibitor of apoptosis-promoting Bax1 protein n=1 Tax=Paramecium tetraurelia TaxID=5888 RepID=A0CK29_PARTE|nr:uncharacterized protein GSPATT00000858001 [Paramecium tetraurelia]CAK71146.1 unnamed protein product [Paramecium tetraurelia]|eukprot:XP_001438543.1 hypothetical protein (macronuclear) [Paramecium tetraurelia strain d4-2]
MYQQNLNTFDIEQGDTQIGYKSLLNDENVRIQFIRKVYLILSFQLLFTTIFCTFSYFSTGFAVYQLQNTWLFYVLLIVGLICEISLICCKNVSRKVPNNYIILGVFTFCESWIVSYSCSIAYLIYPENGGQLVLIAAVLTLAITISLTLYAFTTKSDITMAGGSLFIFSAVLLVLGLLCLIFNSKIIHMIYIGGLAILYGFYLIYDTQLLMGNKEYSYSIDDYIVAALQLYIDIIMLFLQLLQLLLELFGKKD